MPTLRAIHLSYSRSDLVPLLDDASFQLDEGFTGLVGENGAGKTTLLRLIAGELAPDSGQIRVEPRDARIVLCPQDVHVLGDDVRAFAAAEHGDARALRDRLRLDVADVSRWPTLSPGERKRWQIGAALALLPDVLLLDEPTNHLDDAARALLVDALSGFAGASLIVSHDRAFLDALTTATLHLERGRVRLWPSRYDEARRAWEGEARAERSAWEQARDRQRSLKRQLGEMRAEHARADASRSAKKRMRNENDNDGRGSLAKGLASFAEARLGRSVATARAKLERSIEELGDAPRAHGVGRSIFVGYDPAKSAILATLDLPAIEVAGRALLHDVRLTLRREDRVHVAGANGAGKSTLLREIVRALRIHRVLHVPQELPQGDAAELVSHARSLDPETRGRVMQLVAALGVEPARLLATTSPSPGEARKLAIALGLGRHVQAVILDEPTNHLDLPSIERLEAALAEYPGALLLVTHDAALAARCTTTRWRIEGGRVKLE